MFRFTIRDVLWLTVVMGIGAGWSVDRVKVQKEWDLLRVRQKALAEEERRVNANAKWVINEMSRFNKGVEFPETPNRP